MSEQWHKGPELTITTGMTDEEIRATALAAAAASWAGISAVRDRDASILVTAEKFEAWLLAGTENSRE